MVMLVTAAGLKDEQDRWLVQQRPEGKALAGLWEFPGGKVDPGETPEAALIRELGEELGIVVEKEALVPLAFSTGLVGDRPLLLLFFRVVTWAGQTQPLHAAQLRWVNVQELRALPMPEPDLPLIEAITQGWPSPLRGS